MESAGAPGKCHISEATLNCLNNAYEVEEGTPNEFLPRVVNYKIKVVIFYTQNLLVLTPTLSTGPLRGHWALK